MTTASHDQQGAWADRPHVSSGSYIRRFLVAAPGLFVVWLALTNSFASDEMIVGAVVAIGAALLSAPHLSLVDDLRLTPLAPIQFIRFLGEFLIALLQANFDVAGRVVSPQVRVNPKIVEVKTGLRSDLGRYWLANAITLTPGTLTVDVVGETLSVHWIAVSAGADVETATQRIAARFEASLARMVK